VATTVGEGHGGDLIHRRRRDGDWSLLPQSRWTRQVATAVGEGRGGDLIGGVMGIGGCCVSGEGVVFSLPVRTGLDPGDTFPSRGLPNTA
jgi:hypothetical protein